MVVVVAQVAVGRLSYCDCQSKERLGSKEGSKPGRLLIPCTFQYRHAKLNCTCALCNATSISVDSTACTA